MYYNAPLLYEQAYSITINNAEAPLYYFFDYDERSYNINMEFQHFHQFYEVHILLDGKASHIIEGDYYALQPYDIVFLRPALLHKTEYPVGAPRKRLIINFAIPADTPCLGGMLRQALAPFDAEVPIYRLGDAERASAFGYLNDIFTLGKQPRTPLTELAIHSKFVEFLCAVAQACPRNTYVPQEFDDSITRKIYSITSYIHSNYAQELSLDYISKKFFISPYYLSHQFKSVTGFTLINYIQMTRVRNAQQLLLYTDMKIADITAHCGMNRMTFYYHFKDIYDLVEWACVEEAARALAGKKTYDTWQQGFLQILQSLQKDKVFYINVYHSISREYIEQYLYKLTYDLMIGVVEVLAASLTMCLVSPIEIHIEEAGQTAS